MWDTVNALDYELLWRSVDAFAPSPLLPVREELLRHGGVGAKTIGVLGWVTGVDLESEPVRNITTRHGIRAQGLRDLFVAQTGIEISAQKFAKEMERCCLRPEVPFGDKIKIESGAVYRLKPRQSPGATDQNSASGATQELGASASPGPSCLSGSSAPRAQPLGEDA